MSAYQDVLKLKHLTWTTTTTAYSHLNIMAKDKSEKKEYKKKKESKDVTEDALDVSMAVTEVDDDERVRLLGVSSFCHFNDYVFPSSCSSQQRSRRKRRMRSSLT